MNEWVRLWHDMPTDPKWRTIARKSGQRVGDVIAVFTLIMVNASANATERGVLSGFDHEDIATALDMAEADVSAIVAAMQGKVLDGDRLSGWERRQPKREDNSALRAKEWRDKKKMERNRTQPNAIERPDTDTDTDTDTELSEAKASGAEAPKLSASDITKSIFDTGVSILTATGHDARSARSIIGRWRKGYSDSEVLAVLSRCPPDVSSPVEWVPKALQSERAKATGRANGQNRSGHSGQGSTRDLGMEIAAELSRNAGGSGGTADLLLGPGASGWPQ